MRHKLLYLGGLALLLVLPLGGCATVSYYSQSVVGHSKLMLARQPIAEAIEHADSELGRQLALSVELKQFAVESLGLPNSKSYSHYVSLDREFPVWNVVAAPEFSVVPKQWCYLIIGCASYRGYFAKQAALDYANNLTLDGFETVVVGATAYSTLGWFADPILPSMLRYGDIQFAETLFHELAHQQLYVNGDSAFNEAFASIVGEVGTRRWLAKNRPDELNNYERQLAAVDQFHDLILHTKTRLSALYAQPLNEVELRNAKHQAFTEMRRDYQRLKTESWQGRGWFDRWFDTPVNNARLAAFSTYRDRLPALRTLLAACGESLDSFYNALATLESRDGSLELSQASCEKSR